MSDYPIGDMIARHEEIRAEIDEDTKAFDKILEPKKRAMDVIAAAIKKEMIAQKQKSVKADAGTAYLSHVLSVKVDNREKFLEFIQDGHWEFLDARPLKEPVKQWIDENSEEINGELVPLKSTAEIGLTTVWNVNLNIRKPT